MEHLTGQKVLGSVSTQQYPVMPFMNRLLIHQSVMAAYAASLGSGWSLPTCMCSTQHSTYAQESYHHKLQHTCTLYHA